MISCMNGYISNNGETTLALNFLYLPVSLNNHTFASNSDLSAASRFLSLKLLVNLSLFEEIMTSQNSRFELSLQ